MRMHFTQIFVCGTQPSCDIHDPLQDIVTVSPDGSAVVSLRQDRLPRLFVTQVCHGEYHYKACISLGTEELVHGW